MNDISLKYKNERGKKKELISFVTKTQETILINNNNNYLIRTYCVTSIYNGKH